MLGPDKLSTFNNTVRMYPAPAMGTSDTIYLKVLDSYLFFFVANGLKSIFEGPFLLAWKSDCVLCASGLGAFFWLLFPLSLLIILFFQVINLWPAVLAIAR